MRMRRFLFLALAVCFASGMKAQLATAEELKAVKYALFGNQNWKKIAKSIGANNVLDENKAIRYVKVVETPNRTKEELFDTMKQWVTSKFSSADCDIRMMDKETCCIIAKGSVRDVAESDVLWGDGYKISLCPVIRIDAKDGRARITFTVSSYNIHRHNYTISSDRDELWAVSSCFPFVSSDMDLHSLSSSKALVMTHVCATRFISIIESALLTYHPVTTEDDNW